MEQGEEKLRLTEALLLELLNHKNMPRQKRLAIQNITATTIEMVENAENPKDTLDTLALIVHCIAPAMLLGIKHSVIPKQQDYMLAEFSKIFYDSLLKNKEMFDKAEQIAKKEREERKLT